VKYTIGELMQELGESIPDDLHEAALTMWAHIRKLNEFDVSSGDGRRGFILLIQDPSHRKLLNDLEPRKSELPVLMKMTIDKELEVLKSIDSSTDAALARRGLRRWREGDPKFEDAD
jgi:hypothetical protein